MEKRKGEKLRISYDKEGDILDLSIGSPEAAISTEIEDDFFIRTDPKTGEVVGFSVLNFEKWFKDTRDFKTLPVSVELSVTGSRVNS